MHKYKVIGRNARFEAENDKIAAVAVATVGDLGFTDRFKLDKFPACWSESEFHQYLGAPLAQFSKEFSVEIAEVIKAIKS